MGARLRPWMRGGQAPLSAQILLLVAGLAAHAEELSDDPASATAPRLEELADYLLAGDERLVRPSPSAETARRQRELAETGAVQTVAGALSAEDPTVRRLAAKLAHLLTTNNPQNRAALGAAGVVPLLVSMAEAGSVAGATDEVVAGSEEAAEAAWILAYNSAENNAAFSEHGGPAALARLLLGCPSARGRMWAGAALGNLCAAYASVPPAASEAVRTSLVAWPGLLEALVHAVRQGPVGPNTERRLWPSEATRAERFSETLVAWGAGQALKNLALSGQAHAAILSAGAVPALCRLRHSPDWLEKMKADLTLNNLGAGCEKDRGL